MTCLARVRLAGLSPRKSGVRATFALERRLDSPRVVKIEDYGPRWQIHHVDVRRKEDLDDELRAWLRESFHTVGTRRP